MKGSHISWSRLNSWFFSILLLCVCPACNHVTRLDPFWQVTTHRIKLPKQMTCGNELSTNAYRSVLWISDKECTICRINTLPLYIDFYEKNRNKIDFYVIISTPYVSSFSQKVYDLCLPFPVIFDDKNRVRRLNRHLSTESEYHFFLLDSNSYPLIVGDPVLNKSIELKYDLMLEIAEH